MLKVLIRAPRNAALASLAVWDAERAAVDRWIDQTVVATANGFRIREVPGAVPACFMLERTSLVFSSLGAATDAAWAQPPKPASVLSIRLVPRRRNDP